MTDAHLEEPKWLVAVADADYEDGCRCVIMPCCGFMFDAVHTDDRSEGKTYTCPICAVPDWAA